MIFRPPAVAAVSPASSGAGASYGHCALKDDLSPVLAALEKADGLALGSPVYFGNVTGAMRSFQERLCFPYLVYDRRRSTIAPRRLAMACIYTMNVDAETMRQHWLSRDPGRHGWLSGAHLQHALRPVV